MPLALTSRRPRRRRPNHRRLPLSPHGNGRHLEVNNREWALATAAGAVAAPVFVQFVLDMYRFSLLTEIYLQGGFLILEPFIAYSASKPQAETQSTKVLSTNYRRHEETPPPARDGVTSLRTYAASLCHVPVAAKYVSV